MRARIINIILLAGCFACAKVPDRFESPELVIRAGIEGNSTVYTLTVSAGIINENSDAALLDYRGELILKDGTGTSLVMPFHVTRLLPFDAAMVVVDKKVPGQEMKPWLELFGIDEGDLLKKGATDEIFIDKDNIVLKNISYRRESVMSLLRGK